MRGTVSIELLGPLRMRLGESELPIAGRKNAALLAYLARRGGAVPRESLMALLWPDSGDAQARASLRQALTALRRAMRPAGPVILAAQGQAITLDPARYATDAAEFEQLARSDDAADLAAAQDLWRGEFLEGLGPVSPEFDRWAEAERGALRVALESVLMRLSDAHEAAGRTDLVIATTLRLLALDPLQESVHRRVIEAYRQQRRFDAALRQFEALRATLQAELGVEPEPATLDLIRTVRRQRTQTSASPGKPEPAASTASSTSVPAAPSIAVLPFRGLPEASDAPLLGEGIAEEVIVNLSRDHGILVVSRQSSFHPGVVEAPTSEIGERLGVRFVLAGSVRVGGTRIRIAAHLARCEDGAEIWAETYDREIGDIFAVQSEIARTVMATVAGRISLGEPDEDETIGSTELGAWRLVLLGLRQLHAHTAEGMRRAVEHLARAAELAPRNGRALGLLTLARIYQRWNYASETGVSDLLPLAERAVALDRRDSRARCAMALACLLSRDHTGAGHHFDAGIAANPNDDLLLIEHGRYLFYVDRFEDSLLRIREAMRLNPLHPDWYWNIEGRCLHLLGRHAEALDAFRRIASPAFYHFAYMATCHRALGEHAAAEAMRARLFKAEPAFDLDQFITALPHQNARTAERFVRELDWLRPESGDLPR